MPGEATNVEGLAQEIAERLAPLLTPILDTRPLLSITAAAERLGISPKSVRNMIDRGELASVFVGEGRRLIEASEIDRYVADRRESGRQQHSEGSP